MLLVSLFPLGRMFDELLWADGHFGLEAFTRFAATPGIGATILRTAVLVGVASVFAVLIGGVIAYLNERTDARMGMVTDTLPFLPFLIPGVAGAVGWVLLLSPQAGFLNAVIRWLLDFVGIHLESGPIDVYSYSGLAIVYTIYLVPFAFLIISAGLRNMDTQLEEQSRICGASQFRTLRKVVLPAMAPSIAAAFLLVVWNGFGMYSVPSVIGESGGARIMSVEVVSLLNFTFPPQYGPAIVLSLVMVGFVGVLWYLQTRVLTRSRDSAVAGRGQRAPRIALGRWRLPVRIALLLYVGAVTVLPIGAMVLVMLNGFWTTHIRMDNLSLAAFREAIFDNPQTQLALKDSFGLALAGATLAVLIAVLVSTVVVRSRSRWTRTADGLLKLPAVISHLVLAIGFVLAFAGPPFRLGGTWTILFIAYVSMFVPQGTLATDPVAVQVGGELNEASRMSGAHGWRTFRKIFFPLMVPGMAIGWALIFVRILGDLEVSQMAAGSGNPTIGSQMLVLYTAGTFSDVAALSVVLVVATSVIVGGVLLLARRGSRWAIGETPTGVTGP